MVRKAIRHKRVPKCIFCPSPADSKEHAWEDWAIQLLQPDISIITGHFEGEELFVPYQKALRIKCLCDFCNTRWLKGLIDDAMPFVRAMSQDLSLPLDIPQQFIVARWATSRAMIWEYMKDPDRPRPDYYTERERIAFRKGDPIPANTFIWLARYGSEDASVGAWVSDYTKPSRCHVTTLLYGHLLVQVLSVRPNPSDPPPVDFKPNHTVVPWGQAHCMIRPTERTAVWPPTVSIGSSVPLADFLGRWDKHPPGELIAL